MKSQDRKQKKNESSQKRSEDEGRVMRWLFPNSNANARLLWNQTATSYLHNTTGICFVFADSNSHTSDFQSDDDYAWIPWYCSLKGNEFFCEVSARVRQISAPLQPCLTPYLCLLCVSCFTARLYLLFIVLSPSCLWTLSKNKWDLYSQLIGWWIVRARSF